MSDAMTQPTIEQMIDAHEWWPQLFCRRPELSIEEACLMINDIQQNAIRAALAAQAGVTELLDYLKVGERDVFGKNVLVMEIGGNIIFPGNSYEAAAFNTLSGLLAAIAAAKGE